MDQKSVDLANEGSDAKKKKKGKKKEKVKETKTSIGAAEVDFSTLHHQKDPNEYPIEKKPNFKYSYKSKYDIGPGSALEGKRVEWEATFERPIEEMLYPSLQFYDNEMFSKKKELFKAQFNGAPLPATVLPEPKKELVLSTKLFSSGSTLFKATTTGTELITPKWAVSLKPSNVAKPPMSLIEEIHVKGDAAIVDQMRTRYDDNMKALEDKRREDELIEKGILDKPSKKKRKPEKVSANIFDRKEASKEADALYEQLELPAERRGSEFMAQTRMLGELSANVAYDTGKRYLEKIVPKTRAHVLEGILYYQVKNAMHSNKPTSVDDGINDDISLDSNGLLALQKPNSEPISPTKKLANRFQRNLQLNFADATKEKDNDESTMRSLDASVLDTDVTKLQRALQSNSIGFNFMDLLKLDVDTVGPYSGSKNLINKRISQDALALSQLKSGVIPESFIKKTLDSDDCVLDMSNYGIGDDQAKCLADALSRLEKLRTLGLRENRLTSASVPYLIQSLHTSLRHLDLSRNNIHDKGCKQLAEYLSQKNCIEYLDISKCNIVCDDINRIWSAFNFNNSSIKEVMCTDNKILLEGTKSLCAYLVSPICTLHTLNIAWNDIGPEGASVIAHALTLNVSLKILDLTANSVQDAGSQRLASMLATNKTLEKLYLLQNNLTGRSCFVYSKVLAQNTGLKNLDISTNPLGEAGARSLFRAILNGLKCFVAMKNCEYNTERDIFNYSYPAADSPYTLDLAEPYNAAIFNELLNMHASDPVNFRIDSATIKEGLKGPSTQLQLQVVNGQVISKSTNQKYVVPNSGTVFISISQSVVIPTLERYTLPDKSLQLLCMIVAFGKSELDKKKWLPLMCTDVYMTVAQAQFTIDYFIEKKTIGAGGLVKLDVLIAVWPRLLDTENMYDFLCNNLAPKDRRELIYALTFECFKFNWVNPTSHWRLNLENKTQRSVMLQLIAINNCESDYGKNLSRRDDTSQYQNWFNFRNSFLSGRGEIIIDKEFLKDLPLVGILEFDYVSTTRPYLRNTELKKEDAVKVVDEGDGDVDKDGEGDETNHNLDEADDIHSSEVEHNTPLMTETAANSESSGGSNIILSLREKENSRSRIITDDQFYKLIEQMRLSHRNRAAGSAAIFLLMELQLASTKYYFHTTKIVALLDYFAQDSKTQARVVITLFSRVWDLYNFDYVMKQLDIPAQHEVFLRIGVLNIVNPLKPNLDFVLPLTYSDNRILVHSLIEISSSDSGDQICEDSKTELSVVSLYGSSNRLLKEIRPEVMRLYFCEVGERSLNVGWTTRADQVRRYLVGDYYGKDKEMYRIINMYHEMMNAGFLARGAIELQYAQFVKQKVPRKKKK